MKKKVLCTALVAMMLMTTTASATAKPWWLSQYRVAFDNELGIIGNVTLQFASDGGSFIRPITKRYGESISLESYVPTKYGYTFKGWFTDPRTKQNQVTTFKFTMPDVIYAKWEKNPEEPINPDDEIMAKDTCYLTDEETKTQASLICTICITQTSRSYQQKFSIWQTLSLKKGRKNSLTQLMAMPYRLNSAEEVA